MMGDIKLLDARPKGIEIYLSIPLESLKKVVKCINCCDVDLPVKDEAYEYFANEVFPDMQRIIKKIEGEE